MDSTPGGTEQTSVTPAPHSLTPSSDIMHTGNVTTTNVTTPSINTVTDMTSMLNVTTSDAIASQKITTTMKNEFIASMNSTSMVDVISTLNVTTSNVISAVNDTLFNSTVTSYEYFNTTNITTLPTWAVTSNDSSSNMTTQATDSEAVLEQRVADSINFWFPPFLFFIGVIANILVVMVMQSKDFRHMSTSFYMSVSSLVDMASLLVSLPAHYLYVNFPSVSKFVFGKRRSPS